MNDSHSKNKGVIFFKEINYNWFIPKRGHHENKIGKKKKGKKTAQKPALRKR